MHRAPLQPCSQRGAVGADYADFRRVCVSCLVGFNARAAKEEELAQVHSGKLHCSYEFHLAFVWFLFPCSERGGAGAGCPRRAAPAAPGVRARQAHKVLAATGAGAGAGGRRGSRGSRGSGRRWRGAACHRRRDGAAEGPGAAAPAGGCGGGCWGVRVRLQVTACANCQRHVRVSRWLISTLKCS